jgi:integrase
MAAPMVKTRTPGIYKRGERYLFSYRDTDGKQRWESCRTLEEARRAKSARSTDIARGEFEPRLRLTLREYALEWVERYQGRGRRGFRDHTRDEYRRQLEQYVFRYFPPARKLTEVTPSEVAGFVAWLCDPAKQDGRALSDSTIRNITKPLRACLASAVRQGLIRSNPARDADMPHRPTAEGDEDEEVRALGRDELATLLELFPDRWRLFFTLLAMTGVRISEAVALQWRHMELDGPTPHVKMRRALVKGSMGPLKSRYARREVPLDHSLVLALREHHKATEWPGDEDPVFPSETGGYLDAENLRRRVLKPTREEACLEWVGFHTFRHTCATLLFAEGRNAVQVQRWLGHHSAAFTLATYIKLLDGDIGAPLTLVQSVNRVQTDPTPEHTTTPAREHADSLR